MPKFYCNYWEKYLSYGSPCVRKTHCLGGKHKENMQRLLPEMDGRSGSEPNWQTNGCISTGKDSSHSILPGQGQWSFLLPSLRGPLSLVLCQHFIWEAMPRCQGWAPSSWDDAGGTCSCNELTRGRPPASHAWASNDEISCSAHDGAHWARNDWTRQTEPEGSLFHHCFYYMFFFTRVSRCCDSGCFLTVWMARKTCSLFLGKREEFWREKAKQSAESTVSFGWWDVTIKYFSSLKKSGIELLRLYTLNVYKCNIFR